MAELVHQTWSRITGKPWSAAAAGGFTTGTYAANIALQQRLLSGWNPYAPAAPAAAAPATTATTRQTAAEAATAKTQAMYAQQRTEEGAKMAALRAYVSGAEPLPALYARLAGEAGIPGLQAQLEPVRQQTLRAEQQLAGLPEELLAVTRGQGEARRKLLEASKSDVLRRQLGELARAQELYAGQLTGAQQALGVQMGLYGEEYKKGLLPFELDLTSTQSRLAREAAGYSQAFQNELTAILGDIQAAEDLAKEQRDRAFELAKMEKEFQYQAALQRSAGPTAAQTAATAATAAERSFENQVRGIRTNAAYKGRFNLFRDLASAAYAQGANIQNLYDIWARVSGYGAAKENPAEIISAAGGKIPKAAGDGGSAPW